MNLGRISSSNLLSLSVLLVVLLGVSGGARADHEADHRYTIWGEVRNADGAPTAGVSVLITGWGGALLGEVSTSADGNFRIKLHVHNQVLGRPFYVTAKDTTEEARFTFDANDKTTERTHRIDLVLEQ